MIKITKEADKEADTDQSKRIGMIIPQGIQKDTVLNELFLGNSGLAQFLFENPDLARIAMRHPEVASELLEAFKTDNPANLE
ncbi:MAG: hypothetical protein WD988_03045 [Candidatus Curtissbacteria bacterium]